MTQSLAQETTRLTFIGAGNMANSIIGGLINKGYPARLITAADPNEQTLQQLQQRYGINTTSDNLAAVDGADAIVLAVKPQVMATVVAPLATAIAADKPLILSIAAGITVSNLSHWLTPELPIVRTMPNTPALVQTGATGLYANEWVSGEQQVTATTIFSAIGITQWFAAEEDMDRVVALSGSGPAYFFLVMEAMEEAGVNLGLERQIARRLTLQTALGAAQLAITQNLEPAELRRRVTSPGGTTEAAIAQLQDGGLAQLFDRAIRAAAERSKALAG